MALDFIIGNARLSGMDGLIDIGFGGGRITAIAPAISAEAPRYDARGAMAFGGFAETHIHLDKGLILDRCPICEGTLAEAIALSARAKAGFTVADVTARASKMVEMAIAHGTNRMRSFVEVDPRAGLRSLEALAAVRRSYAWGIDIELCAFAQDGTTDEPETLDLLDEALRSGATSLGGCPYADPDPTAHVAAIFDLAERHDVAVDFHADFDLNPDGSILPEIIAQTIRRGYQGRVSVGHVTKLSAMAPEQAARLADLLAEAAIAVSILPATDLFLTGRDADRLVPRGVAPGLLLAQHGVSVSLASNNVQNPFTPYGDASLCRIANLYANVAQLSLDAEMEAVFEMVSDTAARQLGIPHALAVGQAADVVLIDAPDKISAVRGVAPVLAGWKNGRQSFERQRARLFPPASL